MIERKAFSIALERLAKFDSLAMLGPRQVGKTTLARSIADSLGKNTSEARYLDLQDPRDRRLLDDPAAYLEANSNRLVILDEIHRMPGLFEVLRGQIDERRRLKQQSPVQMPGKFLILGSASQTLLQQSSESLAGRISFLELGLFTAQEVPPSELERLWIQGGFPLAFLRDAALDSMQWRRDFLQSYVERDLPQFNLQVNTENFERFFNMLASSQGELFDAQRFAKALAISGHTVKRYLDILEQLLLVRVLPPWYVNTGKRLTKSPRPYIRDSGMLHALLRLQTIDDVLSHPVCGKSWEGFVIENLCSVLQSKGKPYFYRTSAGAECDLVIEFSPNVRWAFEVKLSSAPTIKRGFTVTCEDLQATRKILVYRGSERFPMRNGVEAMSLHDAMAEVSAAAL